MDEILAPRSLDPFLQYTLGFSTVVRVAEGVDFEVRIFQGSEKVGARILEVIWLRRNIERNSLRILRSRKEDATLVVGLNMNSA